jgi:glycosyltransferase involved in cell wall biosynthesis
VFLDVNNRDYDVATPLARPIGGSQSALCYLAAALAARGHNVTTVTGTKSPRTVSGVRCLSHDTGLTDVLSPEGTIAVVLNGPGDLAVRLRKILPEHRILILWTQHAHDEPAMLALLNPAYAALWDQIVCVSDWQRTMYQRSLHVAESRLQVLRNAISPVFERMFPDSTTLAAAKSGPPRLAYTSTPFRGLDVLLDCFPEIRRRHPSCRLEVFSSMRVYSRTGTDDEKADEYQSQYERCRATDGIDYRGSVSQTLLAEELRGVHVLAYSNTFAETSCIAVMEALAAGTRVVTSDLAALPETCGGWAKLVPPISAARPRVQFEQDFVLAIDEALNDISADPAAAAHERLRQVEAINASCTWSARAAEWESAAARWLQMRG